MFIVYDSATGEPRSYGEVVADPLPDGLACRELSGDEWTGLSSPFFVWDPATRGIAPAPVEEPAADPVDPGVRFIAEVLEHVSEATTLAALRRLLAEAAAKALEGT